MIRGTVGQIRRPPLHPSSPTFLVREWMAPGGPLELWGRVEVAEHLGCKQSNLPKGLPAPVFTRPKRRGSFWLASDIREFARARGQREGGSS